MKSPLLDSLRKTACRIAILVLATSISTLRAGVFDDVKVWYKGSAGNAVGTSDSRGSPSLMKSLPQLADHSSPMHGASYLWWHGWRMRYDNERVICPYAGNTLDATPCMIIDSPVTTNGMVDVVINGVSTNVPVIAYETGALSTTSWLGDWPTNQVCSNYTVVTRFRSNEINPVSGNPNRVIALGSVYSGDAGRAAGFTFSMNTPNALGSYACPRFFFGNIQKNYTGIQIPDGSWVDFALAVNGNQLTAMLCWDDNGTAQLASISETFASTGPQPTVQGGSATWIASQNHSYSCTFTNGIALSADGENKWTQGFRGAFHQIAFWERTLSEHEIYEAWGVGRPNLVHVGLEGNDVAEFSATETSVANDGAWETLDPEMTSAKPTRAIAFACPDNLAGFPEILRLKMASTSGSGRIAVKINDTAVGSIGVSGSAVRNLYIPENTILAGANTLELSLAGGSALVLDAVTLGGSWCYGKNVAGQGIGLFAGSGLGSRQFNPACGAYKVLVRGVVSTTTHFNFYLPDDLEGRCQGLYSVRAQNTGKGSPQKNFDLAVNGVTLPARYIQTAKTEQGYFVLQGGKISTARIPFDMLHSGWNRISLYGITGGDWANHDAHMFAILPPPDPMVFIVR
ncbi:MAG: hypothetical protein ACOX9C_08420 [Kiritimatiellia bacterium]